MKNESAPKIKTTKFNNLFDYDVFVIFGASSVLVSEMVKSELEARSFTGINFKHLQYLSLVLRNKSNRYFKICSIKF